MQPTIVVSDPTTPTGDVASLPPDAAGTPGAAPTGPRRPPGGWLFGPLLALVFLGYPIQTAFVLDPTPERVLLTLAGAALFAGGFVWLVSTRGLFLPAPADPTEILKRGAAVVCLAALVVALNLGLARGPEWLGLFFHPAAAARLVLPPPEGHTPI